jgi:hypothetical protein
MSKQDAFDNLRVGARVTLRDWQGNSIGGDAFLSPAMVWLAKTRTGAVYPIMPRELIDVENGAAEYFARLQEGAPVTICDWNGAPLRGIAQCNRAGIWECKDASGARWLIEPYRLVLIQPAGEQEAAA